MAFENIASSSLTNSTHNLLPHRVCPVLFFYGTLAFFSSQGLQTAGVSRQLTIYEDVSPMLNSHPGGSGCLYLAPCSKSDMGGPTSS